MVVMMMTMMMVVMMVSSRTAGSRRGPVPGEAVAGTRQDTARRAALCPRGAARRCRGPFAPGRSGGVPAASPPSPAGEARGPGAAPFGQGSALPRPPRRQERRPGRRRPRALPCAVPLPRCTPRPPARAGPPPAQTQLSGRREGGWVQPGSRLKPRRLPGGPGEGGKPRGGSGPALQCGPSAAEVATRERSRGGAGPGRGRAA